MTTVAAETRLAQCFNNCGTSVAQTRVDVVGISIWLPKYCSETCSRAVEQKGALRAADIEKSREEHHLKNRLADANLRPQTSRGDLTLEGLPELYASQPRSGGVPVERYREVVQTVKDFVSVPPLLRTSGIASVMYIYGPEGTGKTWIAEAAVAYVIREMKRAAVFMPLMDFLADVKRGFESGGESEAAILRGYYGADLIAFDDITRRTEPTKWEMETLLRVIDQRLRLSRPTIITANYDIQGLFKLWSDAGDERVTQQARLLCDRLADSNAAISVAMKGRSLRRER